MHVLQGNFGIVYERKDGGLLRPSLVPDIDEIDFIDYTEDNFGISPEQESQNRGEKCKNETDKSFEQRDFKGIVYWASKALRRSSGWQRAYFCYLKAFALFNLAERQNTPQLLQDVPRLLHEAVSLDASHAENAADLMRMTRRIKWAVLLN